MPRLYIPPQRLAGDVVSLAGDEHRHLVRVLRLGTGDRVVLFDGLGAEVEAVIRRAGPRQALLELGQRRQVQARATPPVTLLLGVPRGDRMDIAVQKTTELGIARIVPVLAARTTAGRPRRERWEKIAREAARQSGRADVPEIAAAAPLEDAVRAAGAGATGLVLWEEAAATAPAALPLGRALPAEPRAVALVVGPEGGLTTDEVGAARAAGYQVVTMGPRILRSETAAIAAVAVVQSLLGAME
jgi:16S rRNA (uracil1498-N3)-methyltransferase